MAGGQLGPCRDSWSYKEAIFSLRVSGDHEKGVVWEMVLAQLGGRWQQESNASNAASEGKQRDWGECLLLALWSKNCNYPHFTDEDDEAGGG